MLVTLVSAVFLIQASVQPQAAPLDTMLVASGVRLHFVVHRGTLPVTIVMESGGGATLAKWDGVDRELAKRTNATVVTYERAGFGKSELGPTDLSPATQIRQLGEAISQLGVPSRWIVVGHSYGGLMAVAHADRYRDKVAGVVLIDPMNARFVDATGSFVYSTVPHITAPKNDAERAIERLVRTFDEIKGIARTAEPKLRVPIVVITAGRPMWNREVEDRAWRASHEAIAQAAPGRRLVIAENSGHQVTADRPDTVIDAVLSLLPQSR